MTFTFKLQKMLNVNNDRACQSGVKSKFIRTTKANTWAYLFLHFYVSSLTAKKLKNTSSWRTTRPLPLCNPRSVIERATSFKCHILDNLVGLTSIHLGSGLCRYQEMSEPKPWACWQLCLWQLVYCHHGQPPDDQKWKGSQQPAPQWLWTSDHWAFCFGTGPGEKRFLWVLFPKYLLSIKTSYNNIYVLNGQIQKNRSTQYVLLNKI